MTGGVSSSFAVYIASCEVTMPEDFSLNDMVDFFQEGDVKVLSADEKGVKGSKKRNGLVAVM